MSVFLLNLYMLIISKFRDYYDTIGEPDKQLVYRRDWSLVDSRFDRTVWRVPGRYPLRTEPFDKYRFNTNGPGHTMFVVGFCGKEYVGAYLNGYMNMKYDGSEVCFYPGPLAAPRITYDRLEIVEHIHPTDEKDRRSLLEQVDNVNRRESDELFLQLGCPVYLIFPNPTNDYKNLIVNPRLSDLGFASRLDPVTANQEIAMYLGDRLRARDKDTIEVSDDLRAASRGFDKWSFRRESHPGKPRKKKKNGK